MGMRTNVLYNLSKQQFYAKRVSQSFMRPVISFCELKHTTIRTFSLARAANQRYSSISTTRPDPNIPFRSYHKDQKQEPKRLSNAEIHKDGRTLEIVWDDGMTKGLFPFVWLRDHCQCDRCFNPVSRSRLMLFQHLTLDVKPLDIKIVNESELEIKWSDNHSSLYKSDWLHDRKFETEVTGSKRPNIVRLPRTHWGSEILQNLPTANFKELMTDDYALLMWLQQLEVLGFVLIQNVPTEYGQVKQLGERVSFVRNTHYGPTFSVKAKPVPSNVAYSSGTLELHTDLPFYEYNPGIQMLHCIVQFEGDGAESEIADAVNVAIKLKHLHPEKFKVLANTPVDWSDVGIDEGREFFKIHRQPVICQNSEGEVTKINFNHHQRDSFFEVDHETVFKWYDALKTFHNMLYDPANCIDFKMTPGTIQTFDNQRIAHGRRSYQTNLGHRELEGCYMDWDEVRSKRRVLETKLHVSSNHWCEHRQGFES